MPADRHIMLSVCTPRAGLHHEVTPTAMHAKHLPRRVAIELTVQPADEFGGSGLWQFVCERHAVDSGLNAHIGGGFDLKVAAFLVVFELTGKRPLVTQAVRLVGVAVSNFGENEETLSEQFSLALTG